jgi:PTH1 family peptidyl-tRNA hydrolase
MFLVVGLGNPGRRYTDTRHNVGFQVIETLEHRWSIQAQSKQLGALVGSGRVGDVRAVFARPQSFMNRSGHPVASLAGYYKLAPESVLVIHDDLGLDFGDVRVKMGGGHGGHNGLRDISKHIGAEYGRVRVGVGRPPDGWDTADYVLGRWNPNERETLEQIVETAADAVEKVLSEGLTTAMNSFNVRVRKRPGNSEPNSGAKTALEEQ